MESALRSGSRVQGLISAPGLGKTMLLNRLVANMPDYRHWFYRMTVPCSASEFYRYVATEIGDGRHDGSIADWRTVFLDSVETARSQHKGLLLIFDEAQCLSDAVLSEIESLAQAPRWGAQIIISGQPKLLDILSRLHLATLRQAFADGHILDPLTLDETVDYISEGSRLDGHAQSILLREQILAIAQTSAGVPRVINDLCWEQTRDKLRRLGVGGLQSPVAIDRKGFNPIETHGPGTPEGQGDVAPAATPEGQGDVAQAHTAHVDISEALRALMQDVVSWTGTSGELLSVISTPDRAALSSTQLLAHLSRERQVLYQQGIEIHVGDGLPTLISLRKLTPLPDHEVAVSVGTTVEGSKPAARAIQALTKRRQTIQWSLLAIGVAAAAITVSVLTSAKARLYGNDRSSVPSIAQGTSQQIAGAQQVSRAEQSNALPHVSVQDAQTIQRPTPIEHLRGSALQSDAESQYRLALAIEQSDKLEAYKWLVLSYSSGVEKSLPAIQRLTPQLNQREIGAVRYDIALAYTSGRGVPIDLAQAYKWMMLAKAAGNSDAEHQLDRLSRHMSAQQIAIASKRAEAWLAHKSSD
jgi:type II secretory pathway predicted ATPase ExeA